jgi:hypothetical protein
VSSPKGLGKDDTLRGDLELTLPVFEGVGVLVGTGGVAIRTGGVTRSGADWVGKRTWGLLMDVPPLRIDCGIGGLAGLLTQVVPGL